MTKQQLINQFKLEFPTLTKQVNNDVIPLEQDEYEATLASWADVQLAQEAETAKAQADATAKAALLDRLGITADEAKLLLS